MNNVGKQIWDQNKIQIWDIVNKRVVESKVVQPSRLRDEVWTQVDLNVRCELWDQIWDECRFGVHD
jgi:hypothetical protein